MTTAPRPLPEPADRCRGACGGHGTYLSEYGRWLTADERLEWLLADARCLSREGWHRLRCPTCGGTGRKGPTC